ncbi:hypothetical protein F4780DRAFT_774848 [Xylariomycetidae sp. FL0641]|nr:hypothetical protein F4780DRAFT_774848 [Xylariomycetidae sp. FL0641]
MAASPTPSFFFSSSSSSSRRPVCLAALLLGLVWAVFLLSRPISRAGFLLSPESTPTSPLESSPSSPADENRVSSSPSSSPPSQLPGNNNDPISSSSSSSSRPLILYAYAESANARANLAFFLAQGLHGGADFVFLVNGAASGEAAGALAAAAAAHPANVRVVRRGNTCFDLGAFGEVLRGPSPFFFFSASAGHRPPSSGGGGDGGNGDADGDAGEEEEKEEEPPLPLWRRYARFITLNASVRGPFVPGWSAACWSDAVLAAVTPRTKLVGLSANCSPRPHVQSMLWATDAVGMGILLGDEAPSYYSSSSPDHHHAHHDNNNSSSNTTTDLSSAYADADADDAFGSAADPVGFAGCPATFAKAIHAEVGATARVRAAGYGVAALMAAFFGSGGDSDDEAEDDDYYFARRCPDHPGDLQFAGQYFGTDIHPYETLFVKANRGIDPATLDLLTEVHAARFAGRSWELCG